jgi:uncharacterized protein (TIGR02246 family)
MADEAHARGSKDGDEAAIRAIHRQMIEAWNRGSAEGFAAAFTDEADFVAFEDTHLTGHAQIVAFHRQIFNTVVKGSRLEGEVKFVRFLGPRLALMHSVVRTTLAGHIEPFPGRDSMQLYVVMKHDEGWRAEGLLNACRLTLDQQYFWTISTRSPPTAVVR